MCQHSLFLFPYLLLYAQQVYQTCTELTVPKVTPIQGLKRKGILFFSIRPERNPAEKASPPPVRSTSFVGKAGALYIHFPSEVQENAKGYAD